MTAATPPRPLTVAEYLAMENASEEKHTFWDGAIYAMAGASIRHNQLTTRLLVRLASALADRPCQPFGSDQRIGIPRAGRYFYPDVSVVCRPFEIDPGDELALVNPKLIVEVLSPATEAFDRGEKFIACRGIPTLTEFLLVSQHEPRVERYARELDGAWRLHTLGPDDLLSIASLDVEIAVGELYAGLDPAPA